MNKGLTIKFKKIDFMVAFKNRYPKLLVTYQEHENEASVDIYIFG